MAAWNPHANEIFLQAMQIEPPAQRQPFVDKRCGSDAEDQKGEDRQRRCAAAVCHELSDGEGARNCEEADGCSGAHASDSRGLVKNELVSH